MEPAKNKATPKKIQLEFLKWEMGAFFHFGIRTFYEGHRDWDGKIMPLGAFNPTALSCDNWIKTSKDAGCQYAILVCKHHDGFANWPSKYSNYHVGLTPWKDGKGDVVREFTDACRKHDLKVGLYYSPAEAGSIKRTPKEYDDYFIYQISELLSDYGKIDYLWFDGNGSEGHGFDQQRIIKTIRGLQPEILIFNMWDPDTRWVGNEAGVAGTDNVNQVGAIDFSTFEEKPRELPGSRFLPSESDFMMRDRNWFYSEYDVHTVKSVDELVGIYYYTVGCGSNFLINIGPDRRGLLPDTDAARLTEFGAKIKSMFANPFPSKEIQTKDGIAIEFENEIFINHAILSEDLTEGDGVEGYKLLVANKMIHSRPVCVYTGTAIGHKRIIHFPYIRATKLIVKVTKSNGAYRLNKPEAHLIDNSPHTAH